MELSCSVLFASGEEKVRQLLHRVKEDVLVVRERVKETRDLTKQQVCWSHDFYVSCYAYLTHS